MAGKDDYSTNTTIIPLGGSGSYRPRNIISAISEIQQFYVIESQGQNIPSEFLTLEGSLDLFKIGMRSGFNEGLFIVLLFPVFSFYLLPFVRNPASLSHNHPGPPFGQIHRCGITEPRAGACDKHFFAIQSRKMVQA